MDQSTQLALIYGLSTDVREQQSGNYVLIRDVENNQLGKFDKRLPCCGCGIGWFSFLLGFVFPLMWYYATILYFGKYYHKDPRERGGLAANAVAASICTITVLITVAVILL
ncbi:60S ribosomal protein L18a-like protein isoform X1 [Camellia sinensis]|uniref:60S ribosomal protein L18a-like protein isoform X1 n=1 Tax=Camellia sinensis TaxID=4442 RepID=UPI0010366422|nr:60S ribosomal protein L18a-like protein isoform X1 [Camellia sinensis]XP_028119156.1 60S ribosomal protein L18a-like protein isoform X1 [Camellia sinensis]